MLEPVDEREADERLGELILYISQKTHTDVNTGATKLNKYLYFADFSAVRRLGHPITSAEYQKLKWGPAPRRLRPVRDRLVAEGAAVVERRQDPFGYVHHELVPKRAARLDLFTAEEIEVIDSVVKALRDMTGAQVSDLSHSEAAWQFVDEGEVIPYALAYAVAPDRVVVTDKMREKTKAIVAQYAGRLA